MLSSEERTGLRFTLLGGGVLLFALLAWLGFFADAPTPQATPADLPPTLLPIGHLRGRAVDANGDFGLVARTLEVDGVAGHSDHRVLPADAGLPGSFQVRALPAGRCAVRVAAEGYVTATRNAEIVAGQTLDLGTVALLPLATITGRVVDAAGAGIATNASVRLRSEDREVARAACDRHSAFQFTALLPGRYELDVPGAGDDDSTLAPLVVDMTRGGIRSGLSLQVVPALRLTGQLVLPIGSDPPRALRVGEFEAQIVGDGRFELVGLRAGSGVASVRLAGCEWHDFGFALPSAAVTFTLAAVTIEQAAPPLPTPPPAPRPPDAAGGTATLHILVRDDVGQGCAAVLRLVDPTSGALQRLAYTTHAGAARIEALPAGTWRVDAESGRQIGSSAVSLRDDAVAELELRLADPPP
ncbi:MAG: carboxypeptidase regulatory-like domain-containing protein [Planctomycetes bacterium]|nr:carboxypeptidase regulatory-like domain-containing protein [Planctomycetota bacterium]